MLRRPVKEQYMMPVMTPSVVDVDEFVVLALTLIVDVVTHVVHMDKNTVVVNVLCAVSVITLVTVTIMVCTTVIFSRSSEEVVVMIGAGIVSSGGLATGQCTPDFP